MKLEKWAQFAEVVSGIAVVITLVFLVLGIRENTETTRASMYDRNVDSLNSFRGQIASNPDVAELWERFRTGDIDNLEGADRSRLAQIVLMLFSNYEKAYYARDYGVLGEVEYSRYEKQICIQYSRVQAASEFSAIFELGLTDPFIAYVKTLCRLE